MLDSSVRSEFHEYVDWKRAEGSPEVVLRLIYPSYSLMGNAFTLFEFEILRNYTCGDDKRLKESTTLKTSDDVTVI